MKWINSIRGYINFIQKIDKSEVVEEIVLPDGRERVLFKKQLKSDNGLVL